MLTYYGSRIGFQSSNAEFDCDVCDFRMERREQLHQVEEYASSHLGSKETNLFRNFSDLVIGGKPNSPWPKITLQTPKLIMACMENMANGSNEISIS